MYTLSFYSFSKILEKDMKQTLNPIPHRGGGVADSARPQILFFINSVRDAAEPQRTCEANPAGENSSFIFAVCVKSVPLYHFKLAYIVLPMAVKEFFETHF